MRLLYLPCNRIQVELIGLTKKLIQLTDDFRQLDFSRMRYRGVPVHEINAQFIRMAREFQPDWIHMQLAGHGVISEETLLEIRDICPDAKMTQWYGDWRWNPCENLSMATRMCDCTFLSNNDERQFKIYQDLGAKDVKYWQIAAEDREPSPDPGRWTRGFCFAGNVYPPEAFGLTDMRAEICRKLSQAYPDFVAYGPRWAYHRGVTDGGPSPYNEQIDTFATAKAVMSCDVETGYHYYSGRFPRALMSGSPVVAHRWGGFDEIMKDGVDVLGWDTEEECLEKFDWVQKNPDKAARIGVLGREKAQRLFSWDYWTPKLLEMVEAL